MKSKMLYLGFFIGLLLLISACGSPDFPTAKPAPTRAPKIVSAPTPVPAPTPTLIQVVPATPELKGFFKKEDLIAAYCKGDSSDESFIPFLFTGPGISQSTFPRIQSALLDRDGKVSLVFGAAAKATMLGSFVFGPSYISKSSARAIPPGLLPAETRKAIFPKEYELLSSQEKIDLLFKAIVAKSKERSSALNLDSEAFAKKIWDNLFPPVSVGTISPELQIYVLEVEYLENVAQRGVILNFGPRPDGTQDYEVLKGSMGADAKLALEVFERRPNPVHPFPKITSLPIQNFDNLALDQSLVFYGEKIGANTQTLKRGSISAIYRESSAVAINASVTDSDSGADVFTLKCGTPRFVGMLLGSREGEGKETHARVLGIEKILRFVKDTTGLVVPTHLNEGIAAEEDPALKERLIAALTDGEYDFTSDLCFLKKNCLHKGMEQWFPIFQTVWVSRENPSDIRVVESGRAMVLGEHVAVISRSAPNDQYKYRILWGETREENGSDRSNYEYVELIGFDSTRSVALFTRPSDTKFPAPNAIPFSLGASKELKALHALYAMGSVDFSSFAFVPFPVLRLANDPAYVAGFAPQRADRFYFQGGGEEDTGGALCALRDGECEIVGFIYGDFDKPQEETLGTALTVEFVLDAVREIACSNKIRYLCDERDQKLLTAPVSYTPEALGDRKDIIALLKDIYPSSPLLVDMLALDMDSVISSEAQIVAFTADETGKVVEGPGTIYRSSVILSDKYVLTSSSLLPEFGDDKKFTVRVALLRGDLEAELLKVILIDRESGYALLERPSSSLDIAPLITKPLRITPERNLQTNQDIFAVFSKADYAFKGVPSRIQMVSPGTIIYAGLGSPEFLVNVFVSEEALGAPIYTNCGEYICLVGMVSRTHAIPDKIQTEGFGLPFAFICKNIKKKTGIDLCPDNPQE